MTAPVENLTAPTSPGPIVWIRRNLFNNWYNSILSLLTLFIGYFVVTAIFNWVFNIADWRPVVNFPILYLVGQFPRDQLWRVFLSTAMVSLLMGMSWGIWGKLVRPFALSVGAFFGILALLPVQSEILSPANRALLFLNLFLVLGGFALRRFEVLRGRYIAIGWIVAGLLIVLVILPGFRGSAFLPEISTTLWGGLLVTLLLAGGGITLSIPIAIFLALGRRSSLPVVKGFCVVFIETVRGVPLITILFMFSVIIQLFLPVESRLDRLFRALIGMTLFSAAYTAENLRGGLQAVALGQIEAAKAVGMNNVLITGLIVMPQAIRAVIPALVGQFISLFKDTTLVLILGINELLGIGKAIINSDPEFIRLQAEVYIFMAGVYWILSSIMSYSSRQLEAALGVGER
ncbi:MAG: amino acid ABC transporter permease [Chloroflexi bacterium]|nr:amino acid ABC transporter permease [Chloroflexota bacterium]